MKVKILGGTYGWRDECGRVTRMHAGDICTVSRKEGERLLSLGMAQIEEPAEETAEEPAVKENPEPKEYDAEQRRLTEGQPLNGMRVAQIRALCEKRGAANAARMTKAECIRFLTGEPEEEEEPDDTPDELPDTGAGEIVL